MATLAEIRYDILGRLKGQVVTDDERLEDEYIDKLIRDRRNFLIRDEGKRGLGLHADWYQEVNCLGVKCGAVTCGGYTTQDKQVYVEMPAGVVDRIAWFGTHEGQPFSYQALTAFLLRGTSRFGERRAAYTLVDGKALLRNVPLGLGAVRLVAAVDDPVAVMRMCQIDAENARYPVPTHQVSRLAALVISDILPMRNIQPDTFNNSADETVPAQVNQKAVQAATEAPDLR